MEPIKDIDEYREQLYSLFKNLKMNVMYLAEVHQNGNLIGQMDSIADVSKMINDVQDWMIELAEECYSIQKQNDEFCDAFLGKGVLAITTENTPRYFGNGQYGTMPSGTLVRIISDGMSEETVYVSYFDENSRMMYTYLEKDKLKIVEGIK